MDTCPNVNPADGVLHTAARHKPFNTKHAITQPYTQHHTTHLHTIPTPHTPPHNTTHHSNTAHTTTQHYAPLQHRTDHHITTQHYTPLHQNTRTHTHTHAYTRTHTHTHAHARTRARTHHNTPRGGKVPDRQKQELRAEDLRFPVKGQAGVGVVLLMCSWCAAEVLLHGAGQS